MTASTHTEIYRRFEGTLQPARPRFVPLWRARVATAQKKRLPLLLLYTPPAISGIVFSFIVYSKFTLEAGVSAPTGLPTQASIAAVVAGNLIQVHDQIVNFLNVSRIFTLLVMTWYGAGLICDDRRAGAHLLYFSRPITRVDYFLAQFATTCTFGLRAVLSPALLICVIAVFSSPDYAFLKEKWDVIVATFAFSVIYVAVMSLVILAISALSTRKAYALAAVFGLVVGSAAFSAVVANLQKDRDWRLLSLWNNFRRVSDWMLHANQERWDWNPWLSVGVLAAISVLSIALVAWRLRRMEVVA